jgi:hypothetical protein
LWSWGGVPLLYRKTPGLVQLFRCAHAPDFISRTGETICRPYKTLKIAAAISSDPWWDASRLRNGTLWDDPAVCKVMLSATKEESGQLTLWQLYSFKDLPVELISHIYQLFVTDKDTSVYTPPFVVRLMLDEALSWKRLDRLAG